MDYVVDYFWVLVVALAVLPFVAAWTDSELGAAQYAMRLFGVLVAWFGIALLAAYTHPLLIAAYIVPYFLIYRWSAMRLNAVGRTKWWLLISLINVIGLAYAFKLCFVPDRPGRRADGYPA